MRGLTAHQEIRTELETAHQRVREAIAGLTEEQASAPAPDGWSVKDHLNHLTLWNEFRFFEISRVARGGAASFPVSSEADITPMNEMFVGFRRPLSLEQVVADLEFAWLMIDEAVAAAPEDRLDQRHYQEIGVQGGAGHDLEHAEFITAIRRNL
jgi:hypothetical protein